MTVAMGGTGRSWLRSVRPFLAPAALLALVVAIPLLRPSTGTGPPRGPMIVPATDGRLPIRSLAGRVPMVLTEHPWEVLLVDTLPPERGVQLSWFAGRPTQSAAGRTVLLDAGGSVLEVDARLQLHRIPLSLGERELLSAAPAASGGLWLTDARGEVLRVERNGALTTMAQSAFSYPQVSSDERGNAWLVRSPQYFSYRWDSAGTPLLLNIAAPGARVIPLGSAVVPEHVMLRDLANAGTLVAVGDTLYFVPFIRDEVVALSTTGDTLWLARRGLPQSTTSPRFEVHDGQVQVDYHPVNLGATLGPDGRLYVLSTAGFTTSESRLDVFDRQTGVVLRTAQLPTATPTLAVDSSGRVYLLDEFRLLTGVAPRDRPPFAPFELPRAGGGRVSLADLQGRVALINFWASWCVPCRTELQALDGLRRSIADSDFAFLTLNDDADTAAGTGFLRDLHLDIPVAFGRDRLRQAYHYPGLPFTVLLDRHGRVAQRWIGLIDADQIAGVRATILAELARQDQGPGPRHHHAH